MTLLGRLGLDDVCHLHMRISPCACGSVFLPSAGAYLPHGRLGRTSCWELIVAPPVRNHLNRKDDVEQSSSREAPENERVIDLLLRREKSCQAAKQPAKHGESREVPS